MKKKRLVWSALIMAGLLVLGFFAPSIYWRASGVLRGEAFYSGRPTSFWREQIKADEKRAERQQVFFFGGAPITWRDRLEEWRDKWIKGNAPMTEALKSDADALAVLRELMRGEDEEPRSTAFTMILNHPHATNQDLPELVEFVMKDHRLLDLAFAGGGTFVVFALHKKFGNEIMPYFCKWLDHDDPETVSRAVLALGLCGEDSASAIPLLLNRIECEHDCKASEVLAELGPKALTPLTPLLTKDNVHARRHATFAIAKMTQASSEREPLLRQQLKDQDAKVRAMAQSGLNDIKKIKRDP